MKITVTFKKKPLMQFLSQVLRKYCVRRTLIRPTPRATILPQPLRSSFSIFAFHLFPDQCPPTAPSDFNHLMTFRKPCKKHSRHRGLIEVNVAEMYSVSCHLLIILMWYELCDYKLCEFCCTHSSNYTFPIHQECVKLLRTVIKQKTKW